jgi:hypothetical protein
MPSGPFLDGSVHVQLRPDTGIPALYSRGTSFAMAGALGTIWVVVRDQASRALLSGFKVSSTLRAGTGYTVFAYPASRQQLAALPAELR